MSFSALNSYNYDTSDNASENIFIINNHNFAPINQFLGNEYDTIDDDSRLAPIKQRKCLLLPYLAINLIEYDYNIELRVGL